MRKHFRGLILICTFIQLLISVSPNQETCEEEGWFLCKDKRECIPGDWVCDKAADCEDESDEGNCTVAETTRKRRSTYHTSLENNIYIPCPPNYERCPREQQCIPLAKFCDKKEDCPRGGDELKCNINYTNNNCENIQCEYNCTKTKDGPRCYCPEGKRPNGTSCSDFDECEYRDFFCDQLCSKPDDLSKPNICGCVDGYRLADDNKTCLANNVPKRDDATLLIADFDRLLYVHLNGKPYKPQINVIGEYITSVDYNHRNQTICWISYSRSRKSSEMKCRKVGDSSQSWTLESSLNLDTVSYMAQEWLTNNWYFVDGVYKRIIVCNKLASMCRRVLKFDGESKPKAVALDPNEGYMFFTIQHSSVHGSIGRASLDGTGMEEIATDKIVSPSSIMIDYANKHVYWGDTGLNIIERISYDGSERFIIRHLPGYAAREFGLSMIENYIYVTKDTTLYKMHRTDLSKPNIPINVSLHNPFQVLVYHRQRQPVITDISGNCSALQCKHLCIPVQQNGTLEATCVCRQGYISEGADCKIHCSGNSTANAPGTPVEDCQLNQECSDNYIRCPHAGCIPSLWYCDNGADCDDGFDEKQCSGRCDPIREFQCESGGCISIDYRCDGIPNCDFVSDVQDLSDEEGCQNFCDAATEFDCNTTAPRCLPIIYRCDGEKDCSNGIDEENCGIHPVVKICEETTEFQCSDRTCIPSVWRCDGENDCEDGSDEQCHNISCKEQEFQCDTKRCIPSVWQCDKEHDCEDKSDEKNCNYDRLNCTYPNLWCGKCITPDKYCDGNKDCTDNSDEAGCDSGVKNCSDLNLDKSQICDTYCHLAPTALKSKYVCSCKSGFTLRGDNHTCQAEDMCKRWGVCGQKCVNSTLKAAECACFDGYRLEPDKFTCKPLDNVPVYAIFSNRHEMRRVDLMSYNYAALVSGLHNTIALDFHYNKSNIYWTDVVDDKIYRGRMTSNSLIDVEPIVDVGLATTEGLAIDWIANNLYWVESNLDQIEVASLDSVGMRTTLVAGNMYSPRAIVLDPRMGMLFWTDWESDNPRIESSSMSGEGRKVIFNISNVMGAGWPNGLAIDYDFNRLYWIDARSDSIHTIKYDGSDHRTILRDNENIRHPFAITLFGNHVYWTDWGSNALLRANKFDGSNVTVIQQTITQPFDLQVYHPKRQPNAVNPCKLNNGGCSHLCLINFNQKAGCKCPHLWKLKKDGKKCERDMSFLLFGKNNEIRGVDLINANYSVMPTITLPHVNRPIAVDFDIGIAADASEEGRILWADEGLKVINSALINGSFVDTIIDSGIASLGGFAVDWLSKNMYFSSYDENTKKGSISVSKLNGAYRVEILMNPNVINPGAIALDPVKGNLYWCELGYAAGQQRIMKAKMDGSGIEILYNTSSNPTSLNVDYATGKVYWIEGFNKTIMVCTIANKNCSALSVDPNVRNPTAITVFMSKTLYVAHDKYLASMNEAGKNYTMLRDETTAVRYLRVYDISSRSGTNACSKQTMNCSQLCIPTGPDTRECRCTTGYRRLYTTQCLGIEKFLIYTSDTEVRGVSFDPLDKSEALPLISRIKKAGPVDFHADGDHIYWVDKTSSVQISRIKRDLTGRETIISEEESDVTSIAIDWIAGHLYWTDAQQKIIEVVKVDSPSVRYIILYTDLEYPTSVVVDPLKGKVYWIDSGRFPKVEMANLDGSGRIRLVDNGTVENSDKQGWIGLTKDFMENKLYWCDNIEEKIMVLDLGVSDGQAKMFLNLSEVSGRSPDDWDCQSVTVHEDFVYWIDLAIDSGVIRAINKKNKTVTTGWTGLSPNMHSLKTFDSSIQVGKNPCKVKNGGCKDLCFYNGYNVTCACSYGVLTSDGKNCSDHDSFLFYSKVTSIESLHMYEDMNPPKPPIEGSARIRNVIGLAVDYPNKRVFFSDIQQGNIQLVDFDGKNIQLVVKSVGSAEGIAYDEFSNFLYWTSYTDSTINRKLLNFTNKVTNDSLKETVVTLSSNDHPRAIVLDACSQRMFWTNWNDFHPTIQRAFFSGYNATSIITKDIRTPNGLTIDHKAQRLYWSDARLDKIERCDFDGNNREIVVTTIPQHSFGLALYGEFLYWTDWMRRAVVRANKHDGNIYTFLRKGLQRQPMGIAVVAKDANDCKTNPCLNNPLQCEGKCKVTPRHVPYCTCEPPKVLAEDGVRCIRQELHCGVNDFVCHDGSKCFPRIHVCNGVTDCLDGSDEFRAVCNKEECGPGFYTCRNHQCAAVSARCDGTTNCIDGSDEKDCPCQDGQFKCASEDKCVDNKFVCDFDPDCIDHSDEMGCNIDCSKEEMFANENETPVSCNTTSQCILPSWICDGKMDCFNNTDELDCPNETGNCSDSGFRCNDGACIPLPWRCDGDVDCPDNSDEGEECEYTCPPKMFNCSDQLCLPQSWQCDSYPDCPNGTDELESICSNRTCKDDEFLCSGGRCIPSEWKCDGDPDCPNNEDEGPKQGCQPPECGEGEYQCQNMKCIKKIFYCDGEEDCGDGSDEPSTCRRIKCNPGLFHCGSLCLRRELVCDGHMDCMHGEDEKNCTTPCGKNDKAHYLCSNGVCIDYNLTCNGRNDCGDGSDEPENCNINECQSSTNKCSQMCKDRNIGYECKCGPGFKLSMDKHRCEDINECSTIYPCSHFCINTVGSYKCHCADGYQLDTNGIICKTVGSYKPFLILANRYYLRNISFTGNNLGSQTIIVRNLKNAVAVDFDVKEEFIYWSEITSNSSTINRMNITASERSNFTNVNIQVLHSSTLKNPDGLAIDWVGRNLYWCDKTTDTIEVSRLDGRYRRVILKDSLWDPRALEVFPAKGLLFFSDWGDSAHISRANMDGTNLRTILSDKLAWPNALTIDYVTEKIFWADANYNYIAFADLDGKNMHTVLDQNLPHIFSMTTFMDHIFWTDWEDMSIQRAHKFSGLDRQTIASLIHRPMDIHVYHPMRQASVLNNPCDKLSCSHLCLLKQNPVDNRTLSAVCSCPENHILQVDGTCKSSCTKSQFLCKSSSKCIPFWWKCDGQRDCEDGADEPSNCPHYHCDQKDRFQCKNATLPTDCVLPVQICNGSPDCADKSDEKNCDQFVCLPGFIKCPGRNDTCLPERERCLETNRDCDPQQFDELCQRKKCEKNQFICGSNNATNENATGRGNCIPYVWVCDGDPDCSDGSDEPVGKCKTLPCRQGYRKCAVKGRCVPNSWWCDGDVDCGYTDNSDENSTECEQKVCQDDQMRCDNNHCIPKRWRCDHDNDCKDGSDEKDCTDEDYRNCSDSEFRCDNYRCIPQSMRCDGEYNCEDSSDERNCSNVTCDASIEFSCSSMCIPLSWKCDEEIDCPGGEDERSCQDSSTHHNCSSRVKEFQCADQSCIPWQWQCDGEPDCLDGTDEDTSHCKNFTCPPGMFMCKDHKCIYGNKRCNGQNDCSDGSDEMNCFWDHICSSREFKCQKSNKCIGMDKVCDKNPDCPDGQDEGDLLCDSAMSASCGPNICQHHCVYYRRIRNYKCTCKAGYQLKNNGHDCEVINLCEKWGTCSQICYKTTNRFLCHCDANYILDIISDKVTTCSAIGYKPEILLAHESNLIKSSIQKGSQGGQQEVIHQTDSVNTKIEAVDGFMMDQGGSWKIFTVNRGSKETTIRSFDITVKGSRKKRATSDPIVRGLAEPTAIAVDWVGQHIYWADAQTNKIEMSKFDGSMRRAVVSEGVDEPRSIAVDPKMGKLFWTDRGYPPKISSSNLDGSGKKDLVKSDIIWPNGLAIDYPNQRLYWTDMKKRTVETVDLTGRDRHIVRTFHISNPPYMIDVFEDFLYVSLYKNHTIVKIHKFNNSHITDRTMFSNMQYIGDIVILHSSKQKQNISNACKSTKDNGSELCPKALCINMPSQPGDKNYTCVCPDDAIHNGHGCEFSLPCDKNVCQNNGTCKNSGGKDKCLCPARYSGEQCQIDRCQSYCLNDGTCQSTSVSLVCKCKAEYTGPRCELYKCTGYCQHGGICNVVNGKPQCTCNPLYKGLRCEVSNCHCQNGGTCLHDRFSPVDQVKCQCPAGWTGKYCQTSESQCDCKNGGTCLYSNNELNNNWTCSCRQQFTGPRCEIDKCKNYCSNGGKCYIDAGNRTSCNCTKIFSGDRCQTCSCVKGICSPSGQKCKCENGYSGTLCERHECSEFCQNGGTCDASQCVTTDDNKVICKQCSCVKGYTGERCEEQLTTPAGQSSRNKTTMLLAIIIPIVICLIIFIVVILVVCFKKRRDQFKHHQLSNSNVEVANPVYLQRGDHSTDDDDKENEPLDQNFDFEDHDDAMNTMYNPMYNPIYKADSTQVLLPKGSKDKENVDSNGTLHSNHIVKDKRSKNKGKSKKSSS